MRIASNRWLNRVRDAREIATGTGAPPEPAAQTTGPRAVREAAGSLLAQLAPQERAAVVVLRETFARRRSSGHSGTAQRIPS
jgi:RNA polymerase sigma-70 factor, ECF subfamily